MRLLRRHPTPDERGQVLVLFAAGLVVFLGFAALTIDVGSLYVARRDYQNAADAAALAGAAYLTRPLADPCADIPGAGPKDICARTASWNYLNDQLNLGLSAGQISTRAASNTPAAGSTVSVGSGADYTIWVSTPPNGAGAAAAVSTVAAEKSVMFVRVDRNRDVFFGKLFVPQGFTVSAWATAGVFPNRWAVITLRRGRGGSDIDPGDISAKDIKISGGSQLTVRGGDVGGNYGMRLDGSSSTHLYLDSSSGDDVNAYLIDYVSCGASCWGATQVTDGSGVPKVVKKLPSFVQDPNYVAPPIPGTYWPNGLVDNPAGTPDIPNGDTDATPYAGAAPNITINAGSVSGGGCAPNGPRLGPGTYRDITVTNNSCLVLDPTWRYDDPEAGTAGGRTPVPATQAPGIYYITGQLDIRNNALVVGDGVTIIFRPDGTNNQFSPNGVLDLNRGMANGTPQKLGAWTTKGASPYLFSGGSWSYQAGQESNPQVYGVGVALYVLKPTQYSASATDTDNTDVVKITSSGAGIAWSGVTYAARDNVTISGQPYHDGIGQLVSWTVTFTGGVPILQVYDGPGDGFPYLIEPCVLVSGSCQ